MVIFVCANVYQLKGFQQNLCKHMNYDSILHIVPCLVIHHTKLLIFY